MLEALAVAIPLALAASVSPTSYLLFFAVLASKDRAVRNGLAFLAGGTLAYGAIMTVVLTVSPHARPGTAHAVHSTVHGIVDLALAAVTLAILAHVVTKAPSAGGAPQKAMPTSALAFFMYGAWLKLLSANTLPPYIAAVREISDAHLPVPQEATGYAVVLLVTMLPMGLPYVLFLFNQEKTLRVLEPVGSFLEGHKKIILATILCLVGVFLIYRGLLHLGFI